MTCKQLASIFKSLRTKDDAKLVTKKVERVLKYEKWKERPIPKCDSFITTVTNAADEVEVDNEVELSDDDEGNSTDPDAIVTMLLINKTTVV